MLPPIAERIANELSVRPAQIAAAIALLDEGATVPFVARYRKEVTGGLDDTQLRHLDDRLSYMRELDERRGAVLDAIDAQGKLTAELKAQIGDAETKQRLEDLYLPYKQKRRTRAEIAREAGLEALADLLLADPNKVPETEAGRFLRPAFSTDNGDNPGVADAKAALDGARTILMDRFSEDATLLEALRQYQWTHALAVARVVEGKENEGAKFRDYFEYAEPIAKIPPHRALALFRGRSENVLRVSLQLPEDIEATAIPLDYSACERRIATHFKLVDKSRPADGWIREVVRMTWRAKLSPSIESTLLIELRAAAEEEAIRVFAQNLRDLLLAAPAGAHTTMGLDPGIRTGVKVAVVDHTGKLLDTATIYPFQPKKDVSGSIETLAHLAKKHGVDLVAIGNGTASRETDALVKQLRTSHPDLTLDSIVVSEAGASVYSASEFAAQEFPTLDVSLRGAVSIARRLQDPLAELVKIDPQSIGVGQYQHDVGQTRLAKMLDTVVEDCVNSVGVDVNTASAPLLARVAGLSAGLADNVVAFRDREGEFKQRKDLLKVSRLGPKAYEQAAGFLRISTGVNPLDASAVHPEAYPLVERILDDLAEPITAIMRNPALLSAVNAEHYIDDKFGLPTVVDILAELEKPGRDPRPEFRTATFKAGVNELKDLSVDMVLEGVVTNVTNFGAFVDVGVHQDGLVHISKLADKFVKDPHDVVKAGDIVQVKVQEVDVERKRISLTMRLGEAPAPRQPKSSQPKPSATDRKPRPRAARGKPDRARPEAPAGAMADAFAKALGKG
ncbi:MAG: RNA-binding transcriptional accessory protein [Gammaproteobacteria bacterium]|nr:RNA-binding transcriptional accessory protein [Gammaproteobacteria bacterium]